jgi:hypothetical protein
MIDAQTAGVAQGGPNGLDEPKNSS